MQEEQFSIHAGIEEKHWWFVGRRKILSSIINTLLIPSKTTTVIDIGCGTGANIAYLANQYNCIGIDTSKLAIQHATERFPSVNFICGFAPEDLGDLAKSADIFIITDVMEHIDDDFLFLSSLISVSKPGAYFLITVPADMNLWSNHDVAFGHFRRYDISRLRASWNGLPVKEVLASYYNSRLYPIVRCLRTISKIRNKSWGENSTDFSMPRDFINKALIILFSGEFNQLKKQLIHTNSKPSFGQGVSLIAILQRQTGNFQPRIKPLDIQKDPHQPLLQKEFRD
ncbi:class I SAM-dependent methyltransferase [Armatimonas sp.]|uniref:class I SAM-dependent methyltransferase n=1 Tax=Armatimonas sp. TaxID=1872638 RepID=UPI00374D46E3